MLKKPEFPYPPIEGKSHVCLSGGKYRVYLDRNAALEILFSLYWFASEQPLGEEIDISSNYDFGRQFGGKKIGLCELNLMPSHMHKKIGKNILKRPQAIRSKPHGVYTEEHDRLDYFVSVEEVIEAYEALSELLSDSSDDKRIRVSSLFGTLFFELVEA